MKRVGCSLLFVVGGMVLSSSTWAEEEHHPAKPASARLEQLKKLAGEWVALDDKGKPTGEVIAVYKVVSAGTAVVETLLPGTDHEMVSVYHDDGDDVVMTHYCALGNQPRMKAERGGNPKKFVFKCTGVANAKSESEHHMHEAQITFIDDNHIETHWGSVKDGKPGESVGWKLERKKA